MGDSSDLRPLQHPRFARLYLRVSREAERRGVAEHRRRLLDGLRGQVIEVGAGNGLNFAHYPPSTSEVVAVEPDDVLRSHAEEAAGEAEVPVRVVTGHAGDLPVAEGSQDAVVLSLVLCSVADLARALAELHRVLRPGGQVRFYEHVRSARPWVARAQELVNPLWTRMFGGCNLDRDTRHSLAQSGFDVVELDRFGFRPARFSPPLTHVVGRALKP